MDINDGPVVARQFVANPPFWGSKVASITTPAWQKSPFGSWLIMAAGVVALAVVGGGPFRGVQSSFDGPSSNFGLASHLQTHGERSQG